MSASSGRCSRADPARGDPALEVRGAGFSLGALGVISQCLRCAMVKDSRW